MRKKIFLDNKIKENNASLSEYADANRVETQWGRHCPFEKNPRIGGLVGYLGMK